jgi:tight adherence protein B
MALTIILVVLSLVAVGTAAFALVPSLAGSSRADKRMNALKGDQQEVRRTSSVERQRDARRKSVQLVLKAQAGELTIKRKKRVPLQQQIWQAGLKVKASAFIRNSVLIGIAIFLVTVLLEVPIWFAAVFGLAGGYLGPRLYLGNRRKSYQNKFLNELPNAIEAIVRGIKSGLPLNDSIRVVARDAKEPVKSEFARVLDQQSVGKSMSEAVGILVERVPLPEVNFFVVVITVQQQAGGNLSEALGNLARVLRNRKKMAAKVKAMSSEAKASAIIIGSLPFIVAGLVSIVSPGYLGPLVSTPIGMLWLAVAGIMMAFGIFVMNRMIQFDY